MSAKLPGYRGPESESMRLRRDAARQYKRIAKLEAENGELRRAASAVTDSRSVRCDDYGHEFQAVDPDALDDLAAMLADAPAAKSEGRYIGRQALERALDAAWTLYGPASVHDQGEWIDYLAARYDANGGE